jgi:hypothetical protein
VRGGLGGRGLSAWDQNSTLPAAWRTSPPRLACAFALPQLPLAHYPFRGSEKQILSVLAHHSGPASFAPGTIGCLAHPRDIRRRELVRNSDLTLVIMGVSAPAMVLRAVHALTQHYPDLRRLTLTFRGPFPGNTWQQVAELVSCAAAYTAHTRGVVCRTFVHYPPSRFEEDSCQTLYDRPQLRLTCVASELAGRKGANSEAALKLFAHLRRASNAGLWLHVIVPVTAFNVGELKTQTVEILNCTHGGSIDLVPAAFLGPGLSALPNPDPDDFREALLHILLQTRPMPWMRLAV